MKYKSISTKQIPEIWSIWNIQNILKCHWTEAKKMFYSGAGSRNKMINQQHAVQWQSPYVLDLIETSHQYVRVKIKIQPNIIVIIEIKSWIWVFHLKINVIFNVSFFIQTSCKKLAKRKFYRNSAEVRWKEEHWESRRLIFEPFHLILDCLISHPWDLLLTQCVQWW